MKKRRLSKIINAPTNILHAYGKVYKERKQQAASPATGSTVIVDDSSNMGLREQAALYNT